MNAKFFDLKKEKQDRMLNAALKVFALNGYSHASTDEIVKEAHISKGLLFHYFESKIGVYTFVYDYCVKVFSLELSTAVNPSETSFFKISKQIEAAKMQALKTYPYLILFLNKCEKETFEEAVNAIDESKKQYETAIGTIFARADYDRLKKNSDYEKILNMLCSTLNAVMEDSLKDESVTPEDIYKESCSYIDIVSKMF